MSDTIIKVENISKCYRIGLKAQRHNTLSGKLNALIKTPFQNFRNLRRLQNFKENEQSNDLFWALQDINFEVKQGEVLGIIGRNGAGKSTLLKILAQITEPSSGRIDIYGRIASLLEVGTGFNQELTGRENVYLNGTILGMTRKEIKKKFDEIVDFSGVEKFIDTPVKRYSSGMKVRLAFAVAAHLDPEILLIDEVLAVGDAEFQKKCLGKMQDVSEKEGRTVLFVSHDLGAVRALCPTILLLENGLKKSLDTAETVINLYRETSIYFSPSNFLRPDFDKNKHIIQEISIIDKDGNSKNQFTSQEEFSVSVKTNAFLSKTFGIGIIIKNSAGIAVMHSSSWINSSKQLYKSGELIRISLAELNLVCDRYYLNIFCNIWKQEHIDDLYDIVHFDITECIPGNHPFSIHSRNSLGAVINPHISFEANV